MSLEEGTPKEEPELAQDLSDMDTKLSKDRKAKKDKAKPLAKVRSSAPNTLEWFVFEYKMCG